MLDACNGREYRILTAALPRKQGIYAGSLLGNKVQVVKDRLEPVPRLPGDANVRREEEHVVRIS